MQIQGQLMREKRANLAKSLSQKCKLTSQNPRNTAKTTAKDFQQQNLIGKKECFTNYHWMNELHRNLPLHPTNSKSAARYKSVFMFA